ncbi:membrane protein insertase YidC [Thermomonospora catenispora]|uniref:membrane protein insertase YidC n=1 Tax=Thermomonospora catenispora TaxID=2493090 RepID=UPI001120AD77|nr:membrane protein insertase YidC [Thermomonospora catenispora]TNY37732.1 membrane protein insertase YidC [Thermomonospora catenispora]
MLDWLYELVAKLIVLIHSGLSTVVDPDSGWAWGGSIILLTVLLRLLMVPLFIKQIHASRKLQELNPQVQALRKKYKNDRQRLNQEIMKLYQEHGANPLSGCLPLLVQMPVFIGLFQVLNGISRAEDGESKFGISAELIDSAQNAHILGAAIPDTFLNAVRDTPVSWSAVAVTAIAVAISSTTTFLTMRASMKRQPVMDPDNPMAAAQKIMLVMAPMFGLFGLGFPLGVLMYWVTSNTWTLAQQHYIYSKYPPLGATANGAGKDAAPAKSTGKSTAPVPAKSRLKKDSAAQPEPQRPKIVRQQPSRKPRSKRSGSSKR